MEYNRNQIIDQGETPYTYGGHHTEDTCHFLHMDDDRTIYCVDDSHNVHQCSTADFQAQDEAGTLHVENLYDFDSCSAQEPITSDDELADLICKDEPTEAETMETIRQSIVNGQRAQAHSQWTDCKETHNTTPQEFFEYIEETGGTDEAKQTLFLFN